MSERSSMLDNQNNLTFRGPCIEIYSYKKGQQDALISQLYFGKELYMFWTDLLSIMSLNTVFTATGILSY